MSDFTDQLRRDAASGDSCQDVSDNLAKAADMIDLLSAAPMQVIGLSDFDRLAVVFERKLSREAARIICTDVAEWADISSRMVLVLGEGGKLVGIKDDDAPAGATTEDE